MLRSLSLRLRVFLFFAALAVGNLGALLAGLFYGYRRLDDPSVLNALIIGGVVAGCLILGLISWVWLLFDENVAKPIERLAGGLRARTDTDVVTELDSQPAQYLGDLGTAAADVTRRLTETRSALAEAVARETTRLSTEKERLESLLADVPVGVLLCSPDHQLVFYNGQALGLLGHPEAGQTPGLDRTLFDYLNTTPILHAYNRLLETDDPDAASDILCATRGDGRMLSARMRLLADASASSTGMRPGYVLTLRDITADLGRQVSLDALVTRFFEELQGPATTLQTLTEVLCDQASDHALCALKHEVHTLTTTLRDLSQQHERHIEHHGPQWLTRARDMAASVQAHVSNAGFGLRKEADDLILHCNGFELATLLGLLAQKLAVERTDLGLHIHEEGAGALILLDWDGPPLRIDQLDGWLAEPMNIGSGDLTGHRILARHATQAWPEAHGLQRPRLCLPLAHAHHAQKRPAPIPRAVVYDFELLSKARTAEIVNCALEDLVYVVFDTETTGLMPTKGDEIVQIAAVRIVNSRRIDTEIFDTLVNPGRPIPHSSTQIHGITESMVADAPTLLDVGPRFHRFTKGAVLVAHNAPFDMAFLRRHEAAMGCSFDNPVLDTVLLSAVLFGQSESHSLDALTHRLGITITEEARHTAIGDTLATADVFLMLMAALKARGLTTFGQVLAEVRKHSRLLRDLNG